MVLYCGRYGLLNRQVHGNRAGGSWRDKTEMVLQGLGWRNGTEYALGTEKVFVREAASVSLRVLSRGEGVG